jgi:hypothetical protein
MNNELLTPCGPSAAAPSGPDRPAGVDYTKFLATGFAKRYLATYMGGIDPDERAITEFLVREYRKIEGRPAMLELGCGPGVQHALPAVPYVSQIEMADYLPDNRQEVRRWLGRQAGAHDWNHFTRLILRLEGTPATDAAVAAREEALRDRVTAVSAVDVLRDPPLGRPAAYPVVASFYCAESASDSLPTWERVMARVARLVAPGGWLFLACVCNTDYYALGGEGGVVESIPCARVGPADCHRVLPRVGFDPKETTVLVVPVPEMAGQGIREILLVSARRA